MQASSKEKNPFQQHAESKELIRKLKHEFFQFKSKNEFDSQYFFKLNFYKILRNQNHSKNNQQHILKYVQKMHAPSKLSREMIAYEDFLQYGNYFYTGY